MYSARDTKKKLCDFKDDICEYYIASNLKDTKAWVRQEFDVNIS